MYSHLFIPTTNQLQLPLTLGLSREGEGHFSAILFLLHLLFFRVTDFYLLTVSIPHSTQSKDYINRNPFNYILKMVFSTLPYLFRRLIRVLGHFIISHYLLSSIYSLLLLCLVILSLIWLNFMSFFF